MAAPEGNEFWKLRSKHGRNKIFSTPEILWEAAVEYFEATKKRRRYIHEVHGKDAVRCDIEKEIPFTKEGLYLYLDIDRETWNKYKERKDFVAVTARVEAIIYQDKFEGATVGQYHHSIIARDLGLSEKVDTTVREQPLFPDDVQEDNSDK